jgi:DNA-binding transcriptional LysR family regulator
VTANPELRHLRAFVAVADELHFTRAAQRLHLAQQALSQHVRQLEAELDTQLFRRTTRKVELTDAGQILLARIGPIFESLAEAVEETRRTGRGEAGTLDVAYTPTVAHETLPKLTAALHGRYPTVALRTCEMWQADATAAVEAGRFDVGLARCPVLPDDLESIVIRDEPLGIILAAEHPLARSPVVRVQDICELTLTIWPRDLSPQYHDLVVGELSRNGFQGSVREFENLSRDVFSGDTVARAEVTAGRAFSIGFRHEGDRVRGEFAWRPLDPAPLIPVNLFWKPGGRAVVANYVVLAQEVARSESWLAVVGRP